jgi:hypothetical protein
MVVIRCDFIGVENSNMVVVGDRNKDNRGRVEVTRYLLSSMW